ncbi:hypothetical protein B0H63DRAFT_39856 [Podospora didyma]|uniref:Uncharacterized protein n=1 Tax=Podospora didyma TaxID=330526 RepID=A0AAE0P6E2_9PEZI|nr:hypothetical protein B0H63DRAFT_39856 [Podospora didyma]
MMATLASLTNALGLASPARLAGSGEGWRESRLINMLPRCTVASTTVQASKLPIYRSGGSPWTDGWLRSCTDWPSRTSMQCASPPCPRIFSIRLATLPSSSVRPGSPSQLILVYQIRAVSFLITSIPPLSSWTRLPVPTP